MKSGGKQLILSLAAAAAFLFGVPSAEASYGSFDRSPGGAGPHDNPIHITITDVVCDFAGCEGNPQFWAIVFQPVDGNVWSESFELPVDDADFDIVLPDGAYTDISIEWCVTGPCIPANDETGEWLENEEFEVFEVPDPPPPAFEGATTTIVAWGGTFDLVTAIAWGIALSVLAGGFYIGSRLS